VDVCFRHEQMEKIPSRNMSVFNRCQCLKIQHLQTNVLRKKLYFRHVIADSSDLFCTQRRSQKEKTLIFFP